MSLVLFVVVSQEGPRGVNRYWSSGIAQGRSQGSLVGNGHNRGHSYGMSMLLGFIAEIVVGIIIGIIRARIGGIVFVGSVKLSPM